MCLSLKVTKTVIKSDRGVIMIFPGIVMSLEQSGSLVGLTCLQHDARTNYMPDEASRWPPVPGKPAGMRMNSDLDPERDIGGSNLAYRTFM